MAENGAQIPQFTSGISSLIQRNPIVLKELRSRMRGNRATIVITIYLCLLSISVFLVYLAFTTSGSGYPDPSELQILGKTIFSVVVIIQLLMISFLTPAITANAVSGERDRQTYDLLRATTLSAREIVFGKLVSAVLFVMLLMFAALPLQGIAFLFGGVELTEFALSTILLVITTTIFSLIGIFYSVVVKRTVISTMLAYATSNLVIIGLPILIVSLLAIFGPYIGEYFNNPSNQNTIEILVLIVGWLLIAANPLSTAFVTELILIENGGVFYVDLPLNNGQTVFVPSPWIGFCIIFIFFSLVIYKFTIRLADRKEK